MIGKKIKELRLLNNKTQEELATFLKIAPQTVYKYEKNINEPDLDTTKKIANYFNISVDELIHNTDKPEKDMFDNPMTLAASMKNNADLSEISDHDKNIIRTLIEQMKKK